MDMTWTDEAKNRLARVPEGFMRNMTKTRIEGFAKEKGVNLITLEIAEDVVGEARKAMTGMPVLKGFNSGMGGTVKPAVAGLKPATTTASFYKCNLCGYVAEGSAPHRCPVCGAGRNRFELIDKPSADSELVKEVKWNPDAIERLEKIPAGFMRDMTRWRIEKMARQKDIAAVTLDLMQEKYDYWAEGSAKVQRMLKWSKDAEEKIERIPSFVRGMVIKEVEALAEKKGLKEITTKLIEEAKDVWGGSMEFHSEPVSVGETLVVSRNREGTSPIEALGDRRSFPTRDFHGKTHQHEFLEQLKRDVFSHEAVNHPFLERFSKGGLTVEQVNTFAIHYYQHAKMFSHYIANIIPKIPHEWDRMSMVKNLMDEYGNLSPEKTHPALFRKFLMALGLEKKDWKKIKPIPEVTNFIDRLTMLTRYEPFLIGLGAVGPGVEWLIPAMFKKIVAGLKKSVSLEENDLEYWTSHIILDVEHGEAATKILTNYLHGKDTGDMLRKGAMKSLEARKILWDGFERLLGF